MMGGTLLIVGVLVAVIWIAIEVKRLKHKVFAVALIGLILFSYISAAVIFKGEEIDFKSPSGLLEASKLYFSWLGSVAGNLGQITSNAINMDWSGQTQTSDDDSS